MKCISKKLWAGLLLSCSLAGLSTAASADYWLINLNLDRPAPELEYGYQFLGTERFISYFDCRDRGLKNQSILSNVGIRLGFMCINDKDMDDATEDTAIPELSRVDDSPILRVSPIRASGEIQSLST